MWPETKGSRKHSVGRPSGKRDRPRQELYLSGSGYCLLYPRAKQAETNSGFSKEVANTH